jgi:hypothetical protein
MRRREALSIPPCPEYTRQIRQLRQQRALFFRLERLLRGSPYGTRSFVKVTFSPLRKSPGVPRTS